MIRHRVYFHFAEGSSYTTRGGADTSKKGDLESKDRLKRRLEEASQFVDIDQLCLSPQCGFSSTLEGNSLSRDQQIAKLRLVLETAEEVWGTQ